MTESEDKEKQNGVERRIVMAETLTRIDGRLANIEKIQTDCATDRDHLFKRMRQIDKEQTIVSTRQKGIIAIGGMIGLATITMAFRTISTYFSKNPPPPHIPH